MLQHSKECCNKVEELEVEISIVTKENYVARKDEDERIEDCRDTVYIMLQHFKPMSQHKARLKDKKFCCDKEILCREIFQEHQRTTSRLQQSFYVVTQDTHCKTHVNLNFSKKWQNGKLPL